MKKKHEWRIRKSINERERGKIKNGGNKNKKMMKDTRRQRKRIKQKKGLVVVDGKNRIV